MKRLELEAIKNVNQRYEEKYKDMETEEGLDKTLSFEGKVYKGQSKEKLTRYLKKRQAKEIQEIKDEIKLVSEANDFNTPLTITLEWKRSQMWGGNPKAYTNFGFEGESIGGCGYCKTSTATAQALNSDLRIIKLLWEKKSKLLKSWKGDTKNGFNREVLGYGSGYNILPRFEGGVGVSSHQTIIEGLGLKMRCVTDTPNTNVYIIIKGVQ